MSYLFENLSDESFQQLCQALLVSDFPNIQCLPVNQPDGGRDAFSYINSDIGKKRSFIVFQVKFSVNPAEKDSREAIKALIANERSKIEKLALRGAVKYYLMTNIGGTSHLDAGSIDIINTELTSIAGIECYCWWRDDIARRLDANPHIKWSFPNILRASDLLQILIYNDRSDRSGEERVNTIKSYMSYQYQKDSQLKFKQIELQKNIVDLFVDIPAVVQIPEDEKLRAHWIKEISNEIRSLVIRPDSNLYGLLADHRDPGSNPPGAALLLTQKAIVRQFPKIVIEGAPGQGKSTVTQYLCQIHRMILLSRNYEFSKIPDEHRPSDVRIPFRIDLRDYASWLAGRDPFSEDPEAKLPSDTNPILESFISAQIRRYTGHNFSVNDLSSISKSSQLLIVLDGFDEVADVPTRNRLVVEISDAASRLETNALSLQIVVTSRPAAFANSPGFSRADWQHIQLLSLSQDVIDTYTKKWLDGRNADERERRDIASVLREKIRQPHVRDLARNPMQLAILLALVSIQGASLPDKRTALYDKYMEVFFNREAEKSTVVRDHRELLIRIQRFVAYKLQAVAESDGRSGSISESELRDTIREYLNNLNYKRNIVDELFAGLKERVGALVSRVQGTYEFEVQPLREYFAARYLYDTAPYSPSGSQRRGALPDRFDAIASNAYWLNVTRFYAGCYSSGELASLVEGLELLGSRSEIRYTPHIIYLPIILLSDYIFDHKYRLSSKIINIAIQEPNITLLIAQQSVAVADRELVLPPDCGQAEIAAACKNKIDVNAAIEDSANTSRMLYLNSTPGDCKEFWMSQEIDFRNFSKYVIIGNNLEVYSYLAEKDCEKLINKYGIEMEVELFRHGRIDVVKDINKILKQFVCRIISGTSKSIYFNRRSSSNSTAVELISFLSFCLTHRYYKEMKNIKEGTPFKDLYFSFVPFSGEDRLNSTDKLEADFESVLPRNIANALISFANMSVQEILQDISALDRLLKEMCSVWNDAWGLVTMSIAAVEISRHESYTPYKCDLLDQSHSLCARALSAKSGAGGLDWWNSQIEQAKNSEHYSKIMIIRFVIEYMPLDLILQNSAEIGNLCEEVDENSWTTLTSSISLYESGFRNVRLRALRINTAQLPTTMKPRFASLLSKKVNTRASNVIIDKYLFDYKGQDEKIIEVILRKKVKDCMDNPEKWEETLSYIKFAYKVGVSDRWFYRHRDKNFNFPAEVANNICQQANLFPFGLVVHAQKAIAKKYGADIEPVGNIAVREDWEFE